MRDALMSEGYFSEYIQEETERINKFTNKLAKFKFDMGDWLRIATENGATYKLFSNTPIPDSIKQWLTKKEIKYTELLD